MRTRQYVLYNGEFFDSSAPVLMSFNRAFRYGDCLYENIHANGTRPQFLDNHLKRLKTGMELLKMDIPPSFTGDNFRELISRLLNKNRLYWGVKVRLTVFRDCPGGHAPANSKVSMLLESEPLTHDSYVLNEQGYIVDVYPGLKKPVNLFSKIKSNNSLFYVMAGIYKNEKGLDECLLLNLKGRVIESVSSNLFVVKRKKIFTPALAEGCLAGTMRHTLIGLLKEQEYEVDHRCALTIEDIESADELFLSNAIEGIRWILAFRTRRYFNTTSKKLISRLNEVAFENFIT